MKSALINIILIFSLRQAILGKSKNAYKSRESKKEKNITKDVPIFWNKFIIHYDWLKKTDNIMQFEFHKLSYKQLHFYTKWYCGMMVGITRKQRRKSVRAGYGWQGLTNPWSMLQNNIIFQGPSEMPLATSLSPT